MTAAAPWASDAQRAAMASLAKPILGVPFDAGRDVELFNRYWSITTQRKLFDGENPTWSAGPRMTAAGIRELHHAFLGAVRSGMSAGSSSRLFPGDGDYVLVDGEKTWGSSDDAWRVWSKLPSAGATVEYESEATALGRAVLVVRRHERALADVPQMANQAWLAGAWKTCGELALQADAVGSYRPFGGLGDAYDSVAQAARNAADVSEDMLDRMLRLLLGRFADGVAAVLMSTPVLIAGGSYAAWRLSK